MNKQPRMIDADKLLWELALQGFATDDIKRKMDEGIFDSDPIPLPTIKRYKCGECKKVSNANEWNQETVLYFDRTMPQIDEKGKYSDTFVCPACGEAQPRHTIGEVNP